MEKLKEFWDNKTGEERRKIVVYSIASVIAVMLLGGVYMLNSDDNIQRVDEISNPDAKEAQKYNSRTEANQLGKKDSANLNTTLDDLFGSSEASHEIENMDGTAEIGYAEPLYMEPNYVKNSSTPHQGGGYSSHSTYGDYSMWQTEEPKNNSIGYTEIRSVPAKSSSSKTGSSKNDFPEGSEPVYSIPEFGDTPAPRDITDGKQIRAKLLSKGYFQSGRTLSFVLLEATNIGGVAAPKGQIVTGVATEQNNRLIVNFSTVKIKSKIVPARLKLFGSDGMAGLPIAGSSHNASSNVESRVLSEASRIPVVGGIVGSVSGAIGRQPENRIQLSSNVECIIVNYN